MAAQRALALSLIEVDSDAIKPLADFEPRIGAGDMSSGLFLRDCLFAAESARRFSVHSWLSAKHRASLQASGGWARDDEEDGGKALNARQEEDGRQKPIRQPRRRVPSLSHLVR